MEALLDTSVLVGPEPSSRLLPADAAISVVTLAELTLGVLLATGLEERTGRLAVLTEVERRFEALPVDDAVARAYAEVLAAARRRGMRPRPFDALIAATAAVQGVPVFTRDADLAKISGVKVVQLR